MAHYKVNTSHGIVEFDAERPDLSQSEVENVINENMAPQGNSTLKEIGELATMPKRGLRGLGVGLEQLISHPTQPGNALDRAAAAVDPSYSAPKGEKLGAFAGAVLDPVNMAIAAAGGAPFEAGSLMSAMGAGAAAGGGGTILDQLANKGDFSGKQVVADAALGAGTAGVLHFPTTAIYNKLASTLGGGTPYDYAQIDKNPKFKLPESLGGAKPEGAVTDLYGAALKKEGVNPEDLKYDVFDENTAGKRLKFIQEVHDQIDGPNIKPRTAALIKANRYANDIIGGLDPQKDAPKIASWMDVKNKIRGEIFDRSDDLANSFNKYSQAKSKANLSQVFPTQNKYMMRRVAFSGASGAATGSPQKALSSLVVTSPAILSTVKTIASLVPRELKAPISNAVVDVLRQYRRRKQQQDEE